MIDAPFTRRLPDKADRELIENAVGLECDVFCTRDRRTIIKKRDQLRLLPIRVLTPLGVVAACSSLGWPMHLGGPY